MPLSSLLSLLSFLCLFCLLLSSFSPYVDRATLSRPAYTVTGFSDTRQLYDNWQLYDNRQHHIALQQTEQQRGTAITHGNTSSSASSSASNNNTPGNTARQVAIEPPICRIARTLSGCEDKGNRGYWPDLWNRHVHNPKGTPYCAAALSFLLDSCRARAPTVRSGLARNFRTSDSFSALDVITGKRTVPAGCIIGWNLGSTINGHTGISMERWKATEGSSWQANSTFAWCKHGSGSERDGGGWGIKTARIEPYAYLRIRWFTPIAH